MSEKQYHNIFHGKPYRKAGDAPAKRRRAAKKETPINWRLGPGSLLAFIFHAIGKRLIRLGQFLQGQLSCKCFVRRARMDEWWQTFTRRVCA